MKRKSVHVHVQALASFCLLVWISVSASPSGEKADRSISGRAESTVPLVISSEWIEGFGDDPGSSIPDDKLPEGKEVKGIQVALELQKTRIVYGEPIVAELKISNVAPRYEEAYHTYIPWFLDPENPCCEIRAVDERGKDRILWGGSENKVWWNVLQLPRGCFCGYRIQCGLKELVGSRDLPPGEYQLYAIFKNHHTGVPGLAVSVTMDRPAEVSEEEKLEMREAVRTQLEHIGRERARLGDHEFWTGRVISEKVAVKILER